MLMTFIIITGGPDLNGTSLWPMFLFGFLWLFVMTQLFGLRFWKKLPWWTKPIPFLIYVAICVWCYSWIPDKNVSSKQIKLKLKVGADVL